MAFNLEVEFSGLCVYVVDETNARVGVVMPDARLLSGHENHADGTIGQPHVGYLRFDLADLHTGFGSAGGTDPTNEGVHQFNLEELVFDITGAAPPITATLRVPDFEEIAPPPDQANPLRPGVRLLPGLFGSTPSEKLLMRTLLVGGELKGEPVEDWFFNNLFNPGQPAYRGQFAQFVTWRRPVDSVTIRLRPLGGGPEIAFPLAPPATSGPNPTVRLKVANFCATNPLEWPNLGLRNVEEDDEDFKWLYNLVTPASGATWPQALLGGHRFPVPMIPGTVAPGVEDCLGAQIKGSTT